MDKKQVINNLRALISSLGITKQELFPEHQQRVMEEDGDDDVSLLTGKSAPSKSAMSRLVKRPSNSAPATPAPASTGILEQLKQARSWDISAYGGKISQVMKDGETPKFEESETPTNPVDMTVDSAFIGDDDDDFGGLN